MRRRGRRKRLWRVTERKGGASNVCSRIVMQCMLNQRWRAFCLASPSGNAVQRRMLLKVALTCRLSMEIYCRAGVAASATRVLVVASSAGSAVTVSAG